MFFLFIVGSLLRTEQELLILVKSNIYCKTFQFTQTLSYVQTLLTLIKVLTWKQELLVIVVGKNLLASSSKRLKMFFMQYELNHVIFMFQYLERAHSYLNEVP